MAVDVRKEPQWGAWKDINGNASADRVMRDVFSVWIDHGSGPLDAHYAYAIVMGADVDEMATLYSSPPFEILSNTSDVQAVRWKSGLNQAVFWKPGEVHVSDTCTVSVNQGCVLMTKESEKGLALTVANPNQLSDRIEFQVNRAGFVKDVSVDYPRGGLAGSSVSVMV
jgi:chondroitin AC lyase